MKQNQMNKTEARPEIIDQTVAKGEIRKNGTVIIAMFLTMILFSGCTSGLNFEMPDLFASKEKTEEEVPVPKKRSTQENSKSKSSGKNSKSKEETSVSKASKFYPHLLSGKKESADDVDSKEKKSKTKDGKKENGRLSSEELLKNANSSYQAGKYYDASRMYVSWLHYYDKTGEPEDKAQVCNRLGNIARKRQQYQVSLEYLGKAIDYTEAKNPEYLFDAAETLYELEKYPEAQKYFLKVLKIAPQLSQAERYYGLCLLNQGREECFTPLIQTMGEVKACQLIADKSYENDHKVLAEKAEQRMINAAEREGISVPKLRHKTDAESVAQRNAELAAKKAVLFPNQGTKTAVSVTNAPIASPGVSVANAPIASPGVSVANAPIASPGVSVANAPIASPGVSVANAPTINPPMPVLNQVLQSVNKTVPAKPVLQSAAAANTVDTAAKTTVNAAIINQQPVISGGLLNTSPAPSNTLPQLTVSNSPLLESLGISAAAPNASVSVNPVLSGQTNAGLPASQTNTVSVPAQNTLVGTAAANGSVLTPNINKASQTMVNPVGLVMPNSNSALPTLNIAGQTAMPLTGNDAVSKGTQTPAAEILEILIYDPAEKPFPNKLVLRESPEYEKLVSFYKTEDQEKDQAGSVIPLAKAKESVLKSSDENSGSISDNEFSNSALSFLNNDFTLSSSEPSDLDKGTNGAQNNKNVSGMFDENADFGFAQSGTFTKLGVLPKKYSLELPSSGNGIMPNSVRKEQIKKEFQKEKESSVSYPEPKAYPKDGMIIPIPVSKNEGVKPFVIQQNSTGSAAVDPIAGNMNARTVGSNAANAVLESKEISAVNTAGTISQPTANNNSQPQKIAGKRLFQLF